MGAAECLRRSLVAAQLLSCVAIVARPVRHCGMEDAPSLFLGALEEGGSLDLETFSAGSLFVLYLILIPPIPFTVLFPFCLVLLDPENPRALRL